jgi:hypothetical protein
VTLGGFAATEEITELVDAVALMPGVAAVQCRVRPPPEGVAPARH